MAKFDLQKNVAKAKIIKKKKDSEQIEVRHRSQSNKTKKIETNLQSEIAAAKKRVSKKSTNNNSSIANNNAQKLANQRKEFSEKFSKSAPATQKQVTGKLKNNSIQKATTNRLVPNIPTYNSSKNKTTQGVYKKFYSDVVPKVGASVVNTEQKTTKMANAAAKKQEESAQKIKEKTKNDSALGASYLQGLRNPIRTLYNLGKIHDDTADVTNYQAMFQRGSAHITPAMAEKMRSQGQRGREKFFSADQKRDEKIQKSIDDGNTNSFLSDLARAAGGLTSDLPAMLAGGGVSSVVKGGTTAAKVINSLANAATSPATIHYTLQNMGNRYTEALKEGATRDEALNSALMYAYPLAVSERLGGADTAITKALSGKLGGSVLSNVIKGAGSEAIEEAAQTPFESATKMNYKDVPLFSVDKEQDAILNPSQMAYNASIGGILGGVAGGGISVANNAINNTEQAAIENSAKTDKLSEKLQSKVSNIVQNDTLNSEIDNPKAIAGKAKSGIKPTAAEIKSLSPSDVHAAARTEFKTETGVTLPNSEKGTKKAIDAYAERKSEVGEYGISYPVNAQNKTSKNAYSDIDEMETVFGDSNDFSEIKQVTTGVLNSGDIRNNKVSKTLENTVSKQLKKNIKQEFFNILSIKNTKNKAMNNAIDKAIDEVAKTGTVSNKTQENVRYTIEQLGETIDSNDVDNSHQLDAQNAIEKYIYIPDWVKSNMGKSKYNSLRKRAMAHGVYFTLGKENGKNAVDLGRAYESFANAGFADIDEMDPTKQVETIVANISTQKNDNVQKWFNKLPSDFQEYLQNNTENIMKTNLESYPMAKKTALQMSKYVQDTERMKKERQIAKIREKQDFRIKNLKEFHRAKNKAKVKSTKEREARIKLNGTIQKLLISDTSKQIKDRIKQTFADVNLNHLVARNTDNGMINIGRMDITHVEALQDILKSMGSYFQTTKNEQGMIQKRLAYEKMLIDADIILDMYRKEPVLIISADGMITRKDSRPSLFGLQDDDFENIPKVNIDHVLEKMSLNERAVATKRNLIRSWVDAGEAIMRLSKLVDDKSLYNYYDSTKRSTAIADFGVSNYIQDIKTGEKVCDGLFIILDPIMKKGEKYYHSFQEYLLHTNNIDRYNQGVGIWGEKFTADESRIIAEKLASENPEFKAEAKNIYEFYQALMKMRVDSGMVTEEFADMLNEMYPNYVSSYRDTKKKLSSGGMSGNIASVRSGIRRAKGDDVLAILPLHEQMETALRDTIKQAKNNQFFTRLTNALTDEKNTVHGVDVLEIVETNPDDILGAKIDMYNEDVQKNAKDKTYTYTFFHDGKQYKVECERDVALAIKDLMRQWYQDSPILKAEGSIVGVWKDLITTFNPKFIAANAARDIQDAAIYTKGLKKFLGKYPRAIKDIMSGSKDFKKYQALGGFSSSYFSRDENSVGMSKRHNIIRRNTLDRVYHLNYLIEQAPRYTEYLATIDRLHKNNPKGLSKEEILQEALYNSADVTVNFKRRGTWGRFVNNHVTPFFNPAIQGTSKNIRIFMNEEATNKTKAAAAASEVFIISRTIVKLSLVGILPSALNYFLLGDDDDYENKSDLEKARYYFFPTDNGFIKIPKGRLNAFVSGMGIAFYNGITEDDWSGFELDKISELLSYTVGAINPVTENVLSVPTALRYNTNWLGNPIDSKWEKGNPNNYKNYDEYSTTYSIWLAEKFKDSCISPKQIDYVIDQISGVVGDMISPAFTAAYSSRKDSIPERFGGTMERYFKKMFYEDNEKNDIANQFFEAKNTVRYSMDSKDSEDYLNVVNKMYNWRSKVVSYYNDEITAILNNNNLTGDEKQERIKAWKKKKNDFMEKTLDKQKSYEEAAEKYYKKYGNIKEAYLFANKDIFGSKYAIYCQGKDVREKANEVMTAASIDYSNFFDIYSSFVRINRENKQALDDKEISSADVKYLKSQYLLSNKNLSDEQKLIVSSEYSIISDTRFDEAKELKSTYGIKYSTFIDVYEELLKIAREYDDAGAGNQTQAAAQRAFIMEYSGLNDTQKAYFDDKVVNDGMYIPDDTIFDYEGAKSVGFTNEEFKTATVTLSNIKSDYDENGEVDKTSKKKKVIAAIDDMDITTEQKNYLYAANYSTKKGYPNWGNTGYSYDSSEVKFTGDEADTTKSAETTMTRDQLNNLKKATNVSVDAAIGAAMSVANLRYLNPNSLTSKRKKESNGTVASNEFFNNARSATGTKYVLGGNDMKNGIDCSGLICEAMKKTGIDIGDMTAQDLWKKATPIEKQDLKQGDLIFFEKTTDNGRKITHVGISDGKGNILNASSSAGKVVLEPLDGEKWDKYPQHYGRLAGVKSESTNNKKIYSPVDVSTINTGYPFGTPDSGKQSGYHMGTDFKVPVGTAVTAAQGGTVIEAGSTGGAYGNRVVVDMGNGYYYALNHLSDWGVKKGDKVTAGQVIAKSGNTGNSRGAHLEIEVYKGSPKYGNQIDPVAYLGLNGGEGSEGGEVVYAPDTSKYQSHGSGGGSSGSGNTGAHGGGNKSRKNGGKQKKPTAPKYKGIKPNLTNFAKVADFKITKQNNAQQADDRELIIQKYLNAAKGK